MIKVPETILQTLSASFDTDRASLSFLGGGREESDGIAYTYPCQGKERVLKIAALPAEDPAGFLRIEERLKFIHFLGEHGANIVYPLSRADGSLLASVRSGEHVFVAYSMDKVDGHHPGPVEWTPSLHRNWGRMVGQLHRITKLYPTWQCEVMDPASGKPVLGWEQEWLDFHTWCKDPEVKQRWAEMYERLNALPMSPDSYGFIHNDPHVYNILVDGQDASRIVLLDFDVANYHWFVTDISIAMQGLLFDKTGGMDHPLVDPAPLHEFLDAFMQGYETEYHLDSFWLGQLDLLISYRRMLLFTVMQGWLNTKPELRASWKKMIMEDPPILG